MKQAFFLSCALPRALRFLLERVSFIVSVTLLNLSLAQASTADEEIAGLSNVAEQNGTLQHSPTSEAPNILLVVADDLGMFDIGAFGSEIRTPNIDALADNGVSFNSFYTSATCSPTRAMLLTGSDSHAAGLGTVSYTHLTLPTKRIV